MMTQQMECDALICGGGWSGLWAAEYLSRSGKKVILLEKEADLGGLARTITFKGFRFDLGGHRFVLKNLDHFHEIQGLAGQGSLSKIKKISKIYFQNRYVDYPLTFTSLAAIDKKLLAKGFFDLCLPKKPGVSDNFESWTKKHYGRTFFENFFKTYSEKVWGLTCAELPADWAEQRVGRFSIRSFLGRPASWRGFSTDSPRTFLYPEKGMGSLIDCLENRIRQNIKIYKNGTIKKFTKKDGVLKSAVFSTPEISGEISFKHLFSSIPLPELFSIEPFDTLARSADFLRHLRYRSLIIASIVIPKPSMTQWHWCYFPSKDIIFSRLHEPKFWSPAMASDSQKTLICAEIFCDAEDTCWNSEDQELTLKTCDGLRLSGLLGPKDSASDHCVTRIRYAYPLFFRGYKEHLAAAKNALSLFKNLHLMGRSGTHSYFDFEECLTDVKNKVIFS